MCGILGGSNPKWDYQKGISCMKHRGPDGMKVCPLEDFTLAFARLAIMDLSDNGMQPMFSEDYRIGIVFNGEIYGYQKLRNRLMKKGYRFHSTSDTEVILNAYQEWGEKFIAHVDGMFAIAIYDKRDSTVRLFRDRLGIKPLYYFYDGKNFGFSSELKGILNMCNTVSFTVDNTAVYDFLHYLYIPDPKTYYKNIYKILPGHRMIFSIHDRRIVKDSSYWRLDVNGIQGARRRQSDLADELKELVKESVEEQMVADVPVGTFLSGGVDSSIVTYEGYRVNPQLETFSVGFYDSRYNELEYAEELVDRYQLNKNSRIFGRNTFERYYTQMKVWYDEPFADTSAFPTFLVSEMAKDKVAVALTGDGADEVFGGYDRYQFLRKRREKSVSLFGFRKDDLAVLLKQMVPATLIRDKELRERLGIDKDYDALWAFRRYYFKDLPPITRLQYLDLKTYLPGDILTKVDRASMAVSLETRVPMLSRKLVEFSFSLTEEERCPKGVQKGLLKKAYEEEIGKKLLYRPKQGFGIPMHKVFGDEISCQEHILEDIWGM